jgi:hypothetical protein
MDMHSYHNYSRSENALLPSIISLLCRYPQLVPLMPKFNDTRKSRVPEISAIGDDREPVSPLGQLLSSILHVRYGILPVARGRRTLLSFYKLIANDSNMPAAPPKATYTVSFLGHRSRNR